MKTRRFGVLAASVLLATASTLTVGQAAAAPAEDGFAVDALNYARDYGVTPGEATARLAAQGRFAALVERLAATAPHAFAGSSIEHAGDFGLTVRFSGDKVPEEAARLAAEGGEDVAVRAGAARSLAEAEAVLDRAAPKLAADPAVRGAYYDSTAERFVLDVTGEAAVPAELGAARVERSEPDAADGRRGGLPLDTCTSGFSVRNASGTRGILTAGHCGNSQRYQLYGSSTWYSTTYRGEARTATTDSQWHSTGSVTPTFHASSTTTTRTLTGRVLRASQNNAYVCHRGKTTGYSCGTVDSITYRPTYAGACPGTTCSATWIRVSGASLKCYPGDSGGPIFNAYSAYGIYKGQASSGTGAGDCSFMIYQAIDYISGIGVSLLYG